MVFTFLENKKWFRYRLPIKILSLVSGLVATNKTKQNKIKLKTNKIKSEYPLLSLNINNDNNGSILVLFSLCHYSQSMPKCKALPPTGNNDFGQYPIFHFSLFSAPHYLPLVLVQALTHDRGCAFNHRSTRNKGIEQACYLVTQTIQDNIMLEP